MDTPIIRRTVAGYTHLLNYTTGRVTSWEPEQAAYLLENWHRNVVEIPADFREIFTDAGQINSRLFRPNLLSLGMKFGFPTIVNIELDRKCSLRCRHCYIGNEDLAGKNLGFLAQYTPSQIDDLLETLHQLGVFLIVITGGEPFLQPNCRVFLEKAAAAGFVTEIFSNLQYLPKWFEESSPTELKIARIQTSVYSARAKTHDIVTKRKGSWQRTMKHLLELKEHGYYVEAATPLMRVNYPDRNETEVYFKGLDINQSFAWPILNEYYAEKTGKASLNITTAELTVFLRERPDFLIRTDFSETDTSPVCSAGKALFSIAGDGSVFSCSQFPYAVGHLQQNSVIEIYNGDLMQGIRHLTNADVAKSGTEAAYNFCIGNNFSETGEVLNQPAFLRNAAQAVISPKGGE